MQAISEWELEFLHFLAQRLHVRRGSTDGPTVFYRGRHSAP